MACSASDDVDAFIADVATDALIAWSEFTACEADIELLELTALDALIAYDADIAACANTAWSAITACEADKD